VELLEIIEGDYFGSAVDGGERIVVEVGRDVQFVLALLVAVHRGKMELACRKEVGALLVLVADFLL
jgi:hypothetical protein